LTGRRTPGVRTGLSADTSGTRRPRLGAALGDLKGKPLHTALAELGSRVGQFRPQILAPTLPTPLLHRDTVTDKALKNPMDGRLFAAKQLFFLSLRVRLGSVWDKPPNMA